MKIAILSENIEASIRILASIKNIKCIKISVWINNNAKGRSFRFIFRQLYGFLKAVLQGKISFFFQHSWQISTLPLSDERILQKLKKHTLDIGLHATSIIYRKKIIEIFRLGILNSHIGLLPRYRGRSVMEWSILEGAPTGITTFFIDEGIDTGSQIIIRREFPVENFADSKTAKNLLFAQDGEMYAAALEKILQPNFEPFVQKVEEGCRYYVISNLFRGCVDRICSQNRATPS